MLCNSPFSYFSSYCCCCLRGAGTRTDLQRHRLPNETTSCVQLVTICWLRCYGQNICNKNIATLFSNSLASIEDMQTGWVGERKASGWIDVSYLCGERPGWPKRSTTTTAAPLILRFATNCPCNQARIPAGHAAKEMASHYLAPTWKWFCCAMWIDGWSGIELNLAEKASLLLLRQKQGRKCGSLARKNILSSNELVLRIVIIPHIIIYWTVLLYI